MTAVTEDTRMPLADAPSHEALSWHATDWHKVLRNVRRLQVRIVKAMQMGKWHKVRSLQRLLTRSLSARMLAVKRVTENQGQRTAGIDGELWDTPAKKAVAVERLGLPRYRAQPLRRVYIPKQDGKRLRPLSIPTMLDRAQQAVYLLSLDPVAEATGDPDSYGFRRERSAADAIDQLYNILCHQKSAQWILEADIRSCFDELSHEWLLTHIPVPRPILRQWLKAGYIEKGHFHPTEEGSPQGGIISPVIANMALDGLQPFLQQHFPVRSGKRVYLVRYADDFVITAVSKDILQKEVLPLVEDFLQERGLTLSREKTSITHISEGFDFLGQTLRKYNGKLLTKPSVKSQKALLDKVRRILKTEGRSLSAYGLIQRLNPLIQGWANYHRHVVSKRVFQRIDHHIFWALLRWARRRHRDKSTAWIRRRYFTDPTNQTIRFHTRTVNQNGEKVVVRLFRASTIPIRRHIKVRKDANPYDPAWEVYLEQRQYRKTLDDLKDRPRLRHQWRMQRGLCPVCGERITKETGWHNHHIQWRVHGGGDELENRVLLHPNCHQQVHSPDYNGPSLRPSSGVRDA